MNRGLVASALLVPLTLTLLSCGVGSSAGPDNTLSQDQINPFARQLGSAFTQAESAAAAVSGRASGAPSPARASVLVNVPIQARTNMCTACGRIDITGSITGDVNDQGTGALLLQVTETITDWQCIAGFMVNGDPDISGSGTITFLSGAQSGTAEIDFGGGIRWGTSSSEGCLIDFSVLLYPGGGGHLSGLICDSQVDITV